MKLFEFEGKSILRSFGIPVPRGDLAGDAEEAGRLYRELGPEVVLKAQVPTGGRMKAGGVKFAGDEREASSAVEELLGARIGGFDVECVLIERRVPFSREYYAGMTYDQGNKLPIVVVSANLSR